MSRPLLITIAALIFADPASMAAAQMSTPNSNQMSSNAPIEAQFERPDDHVIGAIDAPLLMVEYGSYACGHCARFESEVWPMIKTEFIDTGAVRFIFRPMLTPPAQIAGAGIIASECAAEDQYFTVSEALFAGQRRILSTMQAQGDVLAVYNDIVAPAGLTPEALLACLQDPAMNQQAGERAQQAIDDGVSGTPSFIIRGKILTLNRDGYFHWGEDVLLIDGEPMPQSLDQDSFRRIIEHFQAMP
jgi:protein-disulfide isomerase